jgi:hypothetical protein
MPNVILWALLGRAFYDASYPAVKVPYSETGRSAASANGKWKWSGFGGLLLLK